MSRAMKDSGIPWVGEIPKNWNTPLLKGVFREREEKTTTGEETLLSLSQYTGIKPKSETEIADSHIAANYEGYKVVHKGDFVMNIMLAWNGSYAVSDYDGMISPAYCVYYFRDNSNKRYYHYLLRINDYQAAFKTLSRGIIDSRLRLYPEQFYTFPTLQPPLSEQQRIAEFLDRKCTEIDEAIALQEEFIEELKSYKQSVITEAVTRGINPNVKFKDSGIDWIGKIPQEWNVRAIKTLAILKSGTNITTNEITDDGEGYPVYGGNGLRGYYSGYSNDGDFALIGRQGALCGNINYGYGRFWATDHCVVCYPREEYVLRWFGETLRAMNLNQYSLSSAQPGLSVERIKDKLMPVPPLTEQKQIADYLDNKCTEIDSLIAIKQQKIEELKDYKKSVIYEYVTGKKEVK